MRKKSLVIGVIILITLFGIVFKINNNKIYSVMSINKKEYIAENADPGIKKINLDYDYDNTLTDDSLIEIDFHIVSDSTSKTSDFNIILSDDSVLNINKFSKHSTYEYYFLKFDNSYTETTPKKETIRIESVHDKNIYQEFTIYLVNNIYDYTSYTSIDCGARSSLDINHYKETPIVCSENTVAVSASTSNSSIAYVTENNTLKASSPGETYLNFSYRILEGGTTSVKHPTNSSSRITVLDYDAKFEENFANLPEETEYFYNQSYIENNYESIARSYLKGLTSATTYRVYPKEDNIYTVELKFQLYNDIEIVSTRDLHIRAMPYDEDYLKLVNIYDTNYKYSIYDTINLYNSETSFYIDRYMLNGYIEKLTAALKEAFKTENVYIQYSNSQSNYDINCKHTYNMSIQIDDKFYFFDNSTIELTRSVIIPYHTRDIDEIAAYITNEYFNEESLSVYRLDNFEDYARSFEVYNSEGIVVQNMWYNFEPNPLTDIKITYDETNIYTTGNNRVYIDYEIEPKDAYYESVNMTIEETDVAVLDNEFDYNLDVQTNYLHVLKPGKVKITIQAVDNPEVSDTVEIEFKEPQLGKFSNINSYANNSYNKFIDEYGNYYDLDCYYNHEDERICRDKPYLKRSGIKKIDDNNVYINLKDELYNKNIRIASNVKDFIEGYNFESYTYIVLKNDGNLYEYEKDNFKSFKETLLLENIKEFKGNDETYPDTFFALTNDNKLYIWGKNIFGTKFQNGKELENPILFYENVEYYNNSYVLLTNGDLYYWHYNATNPKKIDSNVDNIVPSYWNFAYEKDNVTYLDTSYIDSDNIVPRNKVIGENVSYLFENYNGDFYIDKNKKLHHKDHVFNIENVKYFSEVYYNGHIKAALTEDNKLYYIYYENDYNTNKYTYIERLIATNIKEIINKYTLITTDGDVWITSGVAMEELGISEEKAKYPVKYTTVLDNDLSVKGVTISPFTKNKITVDEELDIYGIVLPFNATNKNITWEVDNEELASITETGILSALKPGEVKVTTKTEEGKYESTLDITIYPKPNKIDILDSFDGAVILNSGDEDSRDLGYIYTKISPENVIDKELIYTSSDSSIISINNQVITNNNDVDYDNMVSLKVYKKTGDVTITAKSKDGQYQDSITIHVIDKPKFNTNDITKILKIGETFTPKITDKEDGYEESLIKYDYYKDNIIDLDQNGNIVALNEGWAYVSIYYKASEYIGNYYYEDYNGEYLFSIDIEVVKDYVEGINLSTEYIKNDIIASKSDFEERGEINARLYTSDDEYKEFIWTSSDESILRVKNIIYDTTYINRSSVIVEIGTKEGEATLTVSTPDGKYSKSLTYNVVNLDYTKEKIILDLNGSNTYQLKPIICSSNISQNNLVYTSNDKNIAIINENGLISAAGVGETTIRVETNVLNTVSYYKNYNVSVKVIETKPTTKLTINPNGGTYNTSTILHNEMGTEITINVPTKKHNVTFISDKKEIKTVTSIFNGWILSGGGTINGNKFTFGNIDSVIKASWTDNTVESITPTKTGYRFDGWYRDSNYKNKFDFSTKITKDITLYAKFTKIENVPVPEQLKQEPTKVPTPIINKGDVNNDGKISALDYVMIKNHIMAANKITNSTTLLRADANSDGKISALDYVLIKNKIMGG